MEGLIAQQAQHRRDERERDQDGDRDGAGGGQAHGCEEANARNDEREERGKDRRAGKDHGGAGRTHRHACGIGPIHAAALGAVARKNKQRIVDAHSQADHDGQNRGHIIELNPVGGNKHAQRAESHANDGGNQWHPRGHQRAEGKNEHEESDAQPDDLGGGVDRDLIAKAGAIAFDGKAAVAGDIHRLRDGVFICLLHAIRRLGVKIEGGKRNGLVIVDHGEVIRISAGRCFRQPHIRELVDDLILQTGRDLKRVAKARGIAHLQVVLEVGDGGVDGLAVCWIRKLLAIWGLEDHVDRG